MTSLPSNSKPLYHYEVVCTYAIEADNMDAACAVATGIARSLERTGVRRSSGPDGVAMLMKTGAHCVSRSYLVGEGSA